MSPQTPANTFRGLQESIINYGGNKSPELLTCTHEEASVAMAHGYAKIEGKPLAAMVPIAPSACSMPSMAHLQRLLRPGAGLS